MIFSESMGLAMRLGWVKTAVSGGRALRFERELGVRVATVITTSLFGMAFGGWVSGAIFDATGSYKVAFVNGILWNLLNLSIAGWLLWRSGLRQARA